MKQDASCRRHFPLFYVVSLFVVTFLMINFIRFTTDHKVPSMNNFETVASREEEDEIVRPNLLPPYDYNSLPLCELTRKVEHPKLNLTDVAYRSKQCAFPLLPRFFENPEGLMFNWQSALSACDDEDSVRDIELREMGKNTWAVLPSCKEENTLVTFGVRNTDEAVKRLHTTIPNLQSFGTDAFLENSPVYTHFFGFAISEKNETIEMEVEVNGKAMNKTVKSKDAETFFEEDLKLNKIDMLWINPSYGDFPYWRYLRLDGELRRMGITVCQMMIEMPKTKGREWVKLIQPVERNSKFIFMRPTTTENGGARAFFINHVDPQCTRKYME